MDLKVSAISVRQQAVEKLRSAIFAGVFEPGDRLVELELCERLGVSRPSLREALRTLEAEKLVTILPNRGPSIATLSWEEADQIYRVRTLLEGEAAAQFAERAGPEQIREMQSALRAFIEADKMSNAAGRVRSTSDFYDVIMHGCANKIIQDVLEGLIARISFLRARSMSKPGRAKFSAREMKRILTAIAEKDPKAAREAASAHVEAARLAARATYRETVRDRALGASTSKKVNRRTI